MWLFRNAITAEGATHRRFYELPLVRSENPALALSWTLYHVIDESSPLYNQTAEDLAASSDTLAIVVSGYDVVAAQTVHARQSYEHGQILFGRSYVDILGTQEEG
jgi:inward rectifier potassium channel